MSGCVIQRLKSASVEYFENERGFSLQVLHADELRHRNYAACSSGVIGKITWQSGLPRFEHRHQQLPGYLHLIGAHEEWRRSSSRPIAGLNMLKALTF
jgi:hypothetical protein